MCSLAWPGDGCKTTEEDSMPNFSSILTQRSIVLLPLLLAAACGLGTSNADRLARAQAAFKSSEYRAAIIDTKTILQQEPQNREARVLLGRSSMRVNDAATAEKELRRAVDLGADLSSIALDLGAALLSLGKFDQLLEDIQPDLGQSDSERLDILRLRADALMGLRRPEPARALYLEVVAANSGDLSARLGVASSYVAEKNHAEARRSLDETLAIDEKYIPARLASASLNLAMLDLDAAADEYTRAHELATVASDADAQISAMIGLVETKLAQNDLAAAKVALAQLQEFAPDNLVSVFLGARIAFLEEDYAGAEAKLQQVLRAIPDFRPAQFLLAATYFRRGNLGQAEMHLSAVIAAEPDDADARKLMAEIRLQQNRADEAVATLRPLLGSANTDTGVLRMAVRASLEAGEYDNAIGYLRDELESQPGNVDLELDLAAAYLVAGQVAKAEALLSSSPTESKENAYRRDLLKIISPLRRDDASTALIEAQEVAGRWPEDARVRNLIGGIALSTDNLDLARASFTAAQKLAPSDISAYLNLARIDMRQGSFDSARKQYHAALEQEPGSVAVMVALAWLEVTSERPDAALEWLEKARTADSAALLPRLLMARLYINERSFESAEAVAKEAVLLDGSNAEAHNLLGLAQQGLEAHAEALANFEKAAELDAERSEYRLNKVRAQAAQGEYALAERTLSSSGEADLNDMQSSVMMATLKARQGDADAAMKIAKDLQRQHPDNGIPIALEAELLAAAGQLSQAATVYDEALSLRKDDRELAIRAFQIRTSGGLDSPEAPLANYLVARPLDAEVRILLAQSHQARGELARATGEYEQVLATAPNNYVALNNLAWSYFETGDPRAEEIARRAYEQSPQDGSVADTLGWIQVRKGNLAEGIPMLRKAVQYNDHPEVRYHLAAGLAAAGDHAEARRILQDLLAGKDGFPSRLEAEKLLGSL